MVKKILFLFICFFCLSSVVLANKSIYIQDLNDESTLFNEVYTKEDYFTLMNGSTPFDAIVSYYDKNHNLIESYGAFFYNTLDFDIGLSCIDALESQNEGSSFRCSLGQEGIYSSGDDLNEVKYWKVLEYDASYFEGNVDIYDFCFNHKETHNSKICSNLIFKSIFDVGTYGKYQYWFYIGFIEYDPVDFELVCDENTKKDENVKCDLKINATDEIKELTIPLKDDLYELVNYKEVEGWKLVTNDDNTITLTSDKGFKGVSVVLNSEFKISDQTIDEINIEMNDISVTTVDENILDFTFNDKIVLSNNSENKKDELSNPNTSSFNVYIIIGFIMLLGGIVSLLKPKKHFE